MKADRFPKIVPATITMIKAEVLFLCPQARRLIPTLNVYITKLANSTAKVPVKCSVSWFRSLKDMTKNPVLMADAKAKIQPRHDLVISGSAKLFVGLLFKFNRCVHGLYDDVS